MSPLFDPWTKFDCSPSEPNLGDLGRKTYSGGRVILNTRKQVRVTVDSSRLSSGEVEIRWSILEQNDGGVLQIVYAGDEKVEIQAHAILEGQREVVRLDYEKRLPTPGEDYTRGQGWQAQLVGYLMVASGFMSTGFVGWTISKTQKKGQPVRRADWVALALRLILICFGIWALLFGVPPAPPFSF